ncbi:uncharacterized protein MYCFIDRAFT_180043 [Pseudocercospora fijiensis CIRAD86]|uniref:Uncharacterized protein n=1 Tax=Pseudocercospora fijiensis (strain CIRAD86) TaxID=383855 RepID=M2ZDJ3_PSEFD|nr:uncharacterized protein MYCFIDRAFT_180043 [Pseudocercospora fijiensis CIRAD86]EME77169.1 hypothetical protein MYCFIDRAFT_180043 [Pseudocercospora fijiensis CIRAD86]
MLPRYASSLCFPHVLAFHAHSLHHRQQSTQSTSAKHASPIYINGTPSPSLLLSSKVLPPVTASPAALHILQCILSSREARVQHHQRADDMVLTRPHTTPYQSGFTQRSLSTPEGVNLFSKEAGKQEVGEKDQHRSSVEEDWQDYIPNLKKASSASSEESDEISRKKKSIEDRWKSGQDENYNKRHLDQELDAALKLEKERETRPDQPGTGSSFFTALVTKSHLDQERESLQSMPRSDQLGSSFLAALDTKRHLDQERESMESKPRSDQPQTSLFTAVDTKRHFGQELEATSEMESLSRADQLATSLFTAFDTKHEPEKQLRRRVPRISAPGPLHEADLAPEDMNQRAEACLSRGESRFLPTPLREAADIDQQPESPFPRGHPRFLSAPLQVADLAPEDISKPLETRLSHGKSRFLPSPLQEAEIINQQSESRPSRGKSKAHSAAYQRSKRAAEDSFPADGDDDNKPAKDSGPISLAINIAVTCLYHFFLSDTTLLEPFIIHHALPATTWFIFSYLLPFILHSTILPIILQTPQCSTPHEIQQSSTPHRSLHHPSILIPLEKTWSYSPNFQSLHLADSHESFLDLSAICPLPTATPHTVAAPITPNTAWLMSSESRSGRRERFGKKNGVFVTMPIVMGNGRGRMRKESAVGFLIAIYKDRNASGEGLRGWIYKMNMRIWDLWDAGTPSLLGTEGRSLQTLNKILLSANEKEWDGMGWHLYRVHLLPIVDLDTASIPRFEMEAGIGKEAKTSEWMVDGNRRMLVLAERGRERFFWYGM